MALLQPMISRQSRLKPIHKCVDLKSNLLTGLLRINLVVYHRAIMDSDHYGGIYLQGILKFGVLLPLIMAFFFCPTQLANGDAQFFSFASNQTPPFFLQTNCSGYQYTRP